MGRTQPALLAIAPRCGLRLDGLQLLAALLHKLVVKRLSHIAHIEGSKRAAVHTSLVACQEEHHLGKLELCHGAHKRAYKSLNLCCGCRGVAALRCEEQVRHLLVEPHHRAAWPEGYRGYRQDNNHTIAQALILAGAGNPKGVSDLLDGFTQWYHGELMA